ncbi:HNH endonuclease signature motif containing protein, partial [Rhodococcoides kyotonense]
FGHQDECGLSTMSGVVDAELRAYMEAVFSKFAKPGKCNPADDKPDVDGPDDDSDADDNPGDDADSTGGGQEGPTLFDDPDDNPDDPDDDPDDDTAAIATGTAGPGAADADSAGGSETSTSEKARAEVDAELRAVRDLRGQGRRQHDALKVVLRQMLASGKLGQHRGLPVTAVVTMTLKDLEAGTGHAFTATGSMVKMRDAIRMASHAHHYLVIFDNDGRPLHLGRSKRLASKDQRIVLMAADRGCSHPGCSRPATWSQVHHVNEWAKGGCTDIEDLTFGCDQHHRLVGPDDTDWATTKAGPEHQYPGRTLWHAPATVDPSRRGRVNHYHHPGEYLDPERSGAPPT